MGELSLFRGRELSLHEYRCDGSGGAVEAAPTVELVFVRRGCFTLGDVAVTPNEMFMLAPGRRYSIRHPVKGGDLCTVLAVASPEIRALHAVPAACSASTFAAQAKLLAAVRAGDPMEIEERIWTLVRETVTTFGVAARERSKHRAVGRAREVIAAGFNQPLPLGTVADAAGISPYHLCRLFRRATGTSMHRYQTRLRLREAMIRLGGGETDIAGLSLDVGFSNHSHFTTAFRREFGVTPSAWRNTASTSRL